MAKLVPAFLCFDAEPDESMPGIGPVPWTGFTSMARFVDTLRIPLAERSGVEPHATWFFRMDPVIERCFGRADFGVHNHRSTVDGLIEHGDQVAIHVHPQRWDSDHGYVYSDHSDPAWAPHCVRYSAEVFEQTFGEPVRRASLGGRYISESMTDALVELGAQVDTTVEPGVGPIDDDRTYGHHSTAPSTDFRGNPRHPYRVSRRGIGIAATSADDARPLVEIPRTTYDFTRALARPRERVRMRLRGGPGPLPLNLWETWTSPTTFWDLVSRAIDESPIPYLALTARSDPASRPSNQTVRRMLAALPDHPLSKRLAFVDPLVFADLAPGGTRIPAPALESRSQGT